MRLRSTRDQPSQGIQRHLDEAVQNRFGPIADPSSGKMARMDSADFARPKNFVRKTRHSRSGSTEVSGVGGSVPLCPAGAEFGFGLGRALVRSLIVHCRFPVIFSLSWGGLRVSVFTAPRCGLHFRRGGWFLFCGDGVTQQIALQAAETGEKRVFGDDQIEAGIGPIETRLIELAFGAHEMEKVDAGAFELEVIILQQVFVEIDALGCQSVFAFHA